ncbi:hypothetical protein PoB_004161500 [Plakobranchus ocellatus]|uniref:Uncharacterized protein n=1 Tax=Plakobranchus ocellatus TaxID=259542 RepID=A0AAV4B678_9GAST|nr:hypothetical protein PoB_004161500 [Plakobranchus ocellatus]
MSSCPVSKLLLLSKKEMGNPFDDSQFLFSLNPQDIISEEVVQTVRENTSLGYQLHSNFIGKCLVNRENPVKNPLPRNRLALFSNEQRWSIHEMSLGILKSDLAFFTKLYIAYQTRSRNLGKVFQE